MSRSALDCRRLRDLWWRRQNGKCRWCGSPVNRNDATADHIVEKSKGGKTKKKNICMSCADCNNKRSNGCRYQEHVRAWKRWRHQQRVLGAPPVLGVSSMTECE